MRVCNIACKIDCYISNDYIKFFIESIEDLNKRLAADSDRNRCVQIDARNFRPNIVVSGVPAFDEVIYFKFEYSKAKKFFGKKILFSQSCN